MPGLISLGLMAGVLLSSAIALASFGIDPGKVYIDNLHPGSQGEFNITIYNQGDEDTTYSVRPRLPDYTDPDYEPFSYLDWITVTPENLTIPAGGNADITVVVKMPEDAIDYFGRKGEAWISFTVADDEAMVQIEIASRVFISTRIEETVPPDAESPSEITTENNGSVGISADPRETEGESAALTGNGYSWVPLVIALGSVAAGIAVYMAVKNRHKSDIQSRGGDG